MGAIFAVASHVVGYRLCVCWSEVGKKVGSCVFLFVCFKMFQDKELCPNLHLIH